MTLQQVQALYLAGEIDRFRALEILQREFGQGREMSERILLDMEKSGGFTPSPIVPTLDPSFAELLSTPAVSVSDTQQYGGSPLEPGFESAAALPYTSAPTVSPTGVFFPAGKSPVELQQEIDAGISTQVPTPVGPDITPTIPPRPITTPMTPTPIVTADETLGAVDMGAGFGAGMGAGFGAGMGAGFTDDPILGPQYSMVTGAPAAPTVPTGMGVGFDPMLGGPQYTVTTGAPPVPVPPVPPAGPIDPMLGEGFINLDNSVSEAKSAADAAAAAAAAAAAKAKADAGNKAKADAAAAAKAEAANQADILKAIEAEKKRQDDLAKAKKLEQEKLEGTDQTLKGAADKIGKDESTIVTEKKDVTAPPYSTMGDVTPAGYTTREAGLKPFEAFKEYRMAQFPGASISQRAMAEERGVPYAGYQSAMGRYLLNQAASGLGQDFQGAGDPGEGLAFRNYLTGGQYRPLADVRQTFGGLTDYVRSQRQYGDAPRGTTEDALTGMEQERPGGNFALFYGGIPTTEEQSAERKSKLLNSTMAALGVAPGGGATVYRNLSSAYDAMADASGQGTAVTGSRFADWVTKSFDFGA